MIPQLVFRFTDKFLPVQSQLLLEEIEKFRVEENVENLEQILVKISFISFFFFSFLFFSFLFLKKLQ